MQRRYFTLVELLTVVAVIAILAGITIPVVVGMSAKGKETSARADMNAIKLALTQFKADYSVWPLIDKGPSISNFNTITSSGDLLIETHFDTADTANSFTASVAAYDNLTQALTNNVVSGTVPEDLITNKTSAKYHFGNSKKKRYLDPPAKPVQAAVGSGSNSGFFKLDPWGRRYNIALDWNYDGKINLSSTDKFAREKEEDALLGQILIYSYGNAEAADDTEAFLYSWKTNEQQ